MTSAAVALIAVLVMMLAELARSRRNERELLRRGAVAPPGDVYRAMAFVYPTIFLVMAVEGAFAGSPGTPQLVAGVAVFVVAKLLKLWAIAALGVRWSYRVLVLPGESLVTSGPYSYMRHPNYVAVCGEIAGFAIIVASPWTGLGSLLLFGALMRRRVAFEENALKEAEGSGPQGSGRAQGFGR